jgi:DNA-directed RNA polymerase sigma subunit (sigma70/sigma32)
MPTRPRPPGLTAPRIVDHWGLSAPFWVATGARSPTVPEIANRLQLDDEDVVAALQARHALRAASLDAPVKSDDESATTAGDLIDITEKGFARAEDRADLRTLIRVLTPVSAWSLSCASAVT